MAAAAAEQQSSTAHSTKTALVLRAVREMIDAEGPQAKCLVYSCYTKYLDVVQAALGGAGHACARLDGGMRMRERERQMAAFHTDGVRVLLMSLKCGVGLNLTAATTVVLCEPWWNPFVEEQAIDRIHRIGQTRPTRVIRLAVPGTVEEQILKLQESKRGRSEATLGDRGGRSAAARLSERDFMRIFGEDDDDF